MPNDLPTKCSLYLPPKPLFLPKGGVFHKVGDEVPGILPSIGEVQDLAFAG